MTLSLAVQLIGAQSPQAVQVTVSGATIGDSYTVTGQWGQLTWPVRGGDGVVATGTQIVLVDVAAPLNQPVQYTVQHDLDGVTAPASLITVPHPDRRLLTSIDGLSVVRFKRHRNNGGPRELTMRSAKFEIPGRALPAVRYDTPSGETGELLIDTIGADTDTLFTLLRSDGGLLLFRTDGQLRDMPAVQWLLITACPSSLDGADDARTWRLTYDVVDDPQPDAVVAVATWADFDSVYSASTWATFDTEWSTLTWDDFDRVDWSTR